MPSSRGGETSATGMRGKSRANGACEDNEQGRQEANTMPASDPPFEFFEHDRIPLNRRTPRPGQAPPMPAPDTPTRERQPRNATRHADWGGKKTHARPPRSVRHCCTCPPLEQNHAAEPPRVRAICRRPARPGTGDQNKTRRRSAGHPAAASVYLYVPCTQPHGESPPLETTYW